MKSGTESSWEGGEDGQWDVEADRRSQAPSHCLLFTDEVIVAAPLRIADMTSGLIGGEDGRVYVYNGRHTTFGDMSGKCRSWMSPCPEEKVLFSYQMPLMVQGQWLPLGHVHCGPHTACALLTTGHTARSSRGFAKCLSYLTT